MNTIVLTSNNIAAATIVSNVFIDVYMPHANGEYVKVYLYLLRCLTAGNREFSITLIADQLDNTENDIIRALHYWEKSNLISLDKDERGAITSIMLLEPYSSESDSKNIGAEEVRQSAALETAATRTVDMPAEYEKPTYTENQIFELTNTDEVKWLMNIIEIYLERLLTPTDIQLILYLYETLGFSTDLIMHLYDYCVSKNKRNPSYIEAVALSWAKEGIDTVEKAELSITKYNTNYNAINKAFGINRQPGSIEKQYMDKWISKYCFDTSIIVEACNRTLLRTGKPDFKYADKILENWFKKGVKSKKDIELLDEKHNNKNVSNPSAVTQQAKPANKFNAFPQRNYSKEDFSSIEQRLLNKMQ
ncbi:DnaD domain protein [Anaeromicropila populeti]|uniref:DnaD and phage-associated domain-containing protein n=1 Tax=Anaeromicropila populeti TaxID=37658 RepID=A0A1I6IXL6_9FIRM|nr:DnaD domain protein [Anaeromicropila populeti]SFR71492.1 DnaD and phage-associated domain-containing protein [Anaeromicropila populeti]